MFSMSIIHRNLKCRCSLCVLWDLDFLVLTVQHPQRLPEALLNLSQNVGQGERELQILGTALLNVGENLNLLTVPNLAAEVHVVLPPLPVLQRESLQRGIVGTG